MKQAHQQKLQETSQQGYTPSLQSSQSRIRETTISPSTLGGIFPLFDQTYCPSRSRHSSDLSASLSARLTGEKVPIQGKGDLRMKIGSQEAVHPMWVADIQDECILGLDFLELHGCMVWILKRDSSAEEGQLHFSMIESLLYCLGQNCQPTSSFRVYCKGSRVTVG